MKKVMLSVVAALAITAAAPAFAADMPVKAKKVIVATPSPWDIAFGTAFTSDYMFRGISQSNKQPAVQGYFELQYAATPWATLYAGVWGSSLYSGFANAEIDPSAGVRLSFGQFGLDVGVLYYGYPGPAAAAPVSGRSSIGFTEFYAKPSYKVTSWLTVGGIVAYSDNGFNSGESETYYAGNAAIVLPWTLPMGITSTISGEIGRQTYGGALKSVALFADYTTWNIGIAFNYKAVTLDLRYVDTDASPPGAAQCTSTPSLGAGSNICKETYVATLKFDTTFSALK